MDEAESLCSKIGILVNGKFMCFGSPSELKKRYGEGYKITFKVEDKAAAINAVQRKFPNAKPLEL